jgi:hypothetical protein
MGLAPGQGARDGTRYLWCEPDPGVRLLLEAYRDAGLARAAADIIRGWAGEDPRALWERLRAEGPPRGAEAGEVARWAFVQRVSGRGAAWGATCDLNGNGGCDPRTGQRFPFSLAKNTIPIDKHGTLPAEVHPDARAVEPREVARWAAFMVRTMPQAQARGATPGDFLPRVAPSGTVRYQPDAPAQGFMELPTLPADIAPDARTISPGPCLPAGTWVFIDPPYVGTTGYGHDLPRAEVVALARRWAEAGAGVMVTEAEAIPELVAEGWHAVEYDHGRVGQARTFSKQKTEVATMNRAPGRVDRLGRQGGLFG